MLRVYYICLPINYMPDIIAPMEKFKFVQNPIALCTIQIPFNVFFLIFDFTTSVVASKILFNLFGNKSTQRYCIQVSHCVNPMFHIGSAPNKLHTFRCVNFMFYAVFDRSSIKVCAIHNIKIIHRNACNLFGSITDVKHVYNIISSSSQIP